MRIRDKRVVFYLTEKERSDLNDKVSISGLSRESYIRRALSDKTIIAFDGSMVSGIISELRNTGVTLYELLLLAKSRKNIDSEMLEGAIKDNRDAEKSVVEAITKLWQ